MNKYVPVGFSSLILAFGVSSVIASDFTDDINDTRASINAIEKQLISMDVNFESESIDSGLNRTQTLRALEAKYDSLQAIFQNNHVAN